MKPDWKKSANLKAARQDLGELKGLGYQIHEFEPWHWHVTKLPDYTNSVDVWPTKKKMVDRETWRVFLYDDLLKSLQMIFEKYMP